MLNLICVWNLWFLRPGRLSSLLSSPNARFSPKSVYSFLVTLSVVTYRAFSILEFYCIFLAFKKILSFCQFLCQRILKYIVSLFPIAQSNLNLVIASLQHYLELIKKLKWSSLNKSHHILYKKTSADKNPPLNKSSMLLKLSYP